MESTRLFLLSALFFIGFMLWQAWEREHHVPEPVVQQQTIPESAALTQSTQPQPAVTVTPGFKPQAQTEAALTKGELIHVQTDVLDITIDTHGGNIVKSELLKYSSEQGKNIPFTLLNDKAETLYIAQSGLLGTGGPDSQNGQVTYKADARSYQLSDKNELKVNLNWQNPQGIKVIKTFTFKRDSYTVDVGYTVENQSDKVWQGQMYTQLQRQKQPEPESSIFHFTTFTGASLSSPDKLYEKISYDDLAKDNIDRAVKGGWLAFQQHYFISAWVPQAGQSNHYYSRVNGGIYTLGAVSPIIKVDPNTSAVVSAKLYTGPEIAEPLEAAAPGLKMTIDYGWLWFISSLLFWLMKHIYNIVGNWGWAIVIVTLLIKLAFYWLSAKSYRSMASMRKLQPKIQSLKEQYGDDRQRFSQEMMKLYKKEKVNPFSGCLPILVQIPVFIALYWVLIESVELRHAPFILWIKDLSIADPYYVLPILMGISMLVQQKLSPPPPDPMQAKIMMTLPIVFTFLFLQFPAGLVLYWVVNNTVSILQQWFIMRSIESEPKKPKAKSVKKS